MTQPQVDLIVHYMQNNGDHSEAKIIKVHNNEVLDLRIKDGNQEYDRKTVSYRKVPVAYSWHFVEDDGKE
jgi:hypothetical protein